MSYLTRTQEPLKLPQLKYDAVDNSLIIGGQAVVLDQNILGENYYRILANQEGCNDLAASPVCINIFGNPIANKVFHDYLGRLLDDETGYGSVANSVRQVLRSVFETLAPGFIEEESDPDGAFGFNFYVDQNKHVTLHTLGECACLGPNPTGFMVNDRDWEEEGVCEYVFHNIDFDAQQWSLLAGMGHLALLVSDGKAK